MTPDTNQETPNVATLFLSIAAVKLNQSAGKISVCLGKLTEDRIWARGHENENAVGNLVLHLCGNARQWIVHGLGGEPDVRVRDREFDTAGGQSAEQLTALVRQTVEQATAVLSTLDAEKLTHIYEIQRRTVSGVEAVMSVVEHFGQHTGQIVFATKNLTGQDLGLSMPRKPASAA